MVSLLKKPFPLNDPADFSDELYKASRLLFLLGGCLTDAKQNAMLFKDGKKRMLSPNGGRRNVPSLPVTDVLKFDAEAVVEDG